MYRLAVVLLIIVVAFGFTSAQTTKTMTLAVAGMKCDNCATKVDKALRGIEGVKDVNVSLKNNSAKVVLASTSVKTEMLLNAVSDAGFTATSGKMTVAAKKDAKESCSTDKDGKMKKEGASGEDCCKDGKKDEASAKKDADCCKDTKKTDTKN